MWNELRQWLQQEFEWLRDVWKFRRFAWSNRRLNDFTRVSPFSEEDRVDLDELEVYRQRNRLPTGWVRIDASVEKFVRSLKKAGEGFDRATLAIVSAYRSTLKD